MEILANENPMESLIGKELSAVVFVRDYIQFQFDELGLTTITLPTITTKGQIYLSGSKGYRDALCERIGHAVTETSIVEEKGINLKFDDASTISISLAEEDYRGPEAVIFHNESKTWVY